jgi:hypothetical protein
MRQKKEITVNNQCQKTLRAVAAGLVAIGVARPIVKLRTQQDVDRQAVPRRRSPEPARRHLGARGTLANDLNMRELFDDVGIAG